MQNHRYRIPVEDNKYIKEQYLRTCIAVGEVIELSKVIEVKHTELSEPVYVREEYKPMFCLFDDQKDKKYRGKDGRQLNETQDYPVLYLPVLQNLEPIEELELIHIKGHLVRLPDELSRVYESGQYIVNESKISTDKVYYELKISPYRADKQDEIDKSTIVFKSSLLK